MDLQTYLRDIEVANRYGVSRPTIWRWVERGQFPSPVKLSPGCTRWSVKSLLSWEQKKTGDSHG